MSEKSKKEILLELAEIKKILEEKTLEQSSSIKESPNLFSQIIDFFPYPIAIYTSKFTLAHVNKAFFEKIKFMNDIKTVTILRHRICNMQLATAIKKVFSKSSFLIEDLNDPFSMFTCSPDQKSYTVIGFPISSDDRVTYGVIVFIGR